MARRFGPWAIIPITVPEVDACGSPGRPRAERRTPSIAVVSSARACRAISAFSTAFGPIAGTYILNAVMGGRRGDQQRERSRIVHRRGTSVLTLRADRMIRSVHAKHRV